MGRAFLVLTLTLSFLVLVGCFILTVVTATKASQVHCTPVIVEQTDVSDSIAKSILARISFS